MSLWDFFSSVCRTSKSRHKFDYEVYETDVPVTVVYVDVKPIDPKVDRVDRPDTDPNDWIDPSDIPEN